MNIDFTWLGFFFFLFILDRCSVGLYFVGLSPWKGQGSVGDTSQMAAARCWLALAVDLACRMLIFFYFPPSSLEAFGVSWHGFKWVPSNLEALPAFFFLTCCFQACSLWTAAAILHKGGRLSFGMEGPAWKTPGEEVACGVKHVSNRWNNPLAVCWKCLPGGNSEPGAVKKEDTFPFISSLFFYFSLAKIMRLLLRKDLVWGKTQSPSWTDGAAKRGGGEESWKEMEGWVWSEDRERE